MKRTAFVYKIHFELDRWQSLRVVEPRLEANGDLLLNGRKRKNAWVPPRVEVEDVEKEKGDLYWMPPNTLVVRPRAKKLFEEDYYFDAEYLPLEFDEEELYALNFTGCFACLNREKSDLDINPENGEVTGIKKYVFYPHRFSFTTVFKIPELNGLESFCYEGIKDEDQEFRFRVEQCLIRGLHFEKVFSFPSRAVYRDHQLR